MRTTLQPHTTARHRPLVSLVAMVLVGLVAGQTAVVPSVWADIAPPGPPVAEPDLPPPTEGPAPAPVAPGPPAAPLDGPGAPAPGGAPASFAASQPEVAAALDAEADNSDVLWFSAGCLLNIIGVGVAYLVEPTPPYARLAGKPADYVNRYVYAYMAAGRSAQTRMAVYGCGTYMLAGGVFYVIAISTLSGP
jgi:hypothetical protein